MTNFDIQYADKPVNVQSTAAYARPQTAGYEAIARAGQAMFSIGQDLQQQQDALDYSEGQRRISEHYNAAMDSLTGDEASDLQVWEKLQQDIGGVEYKSNRVNRELQIYRNRTMPDIQQGLNKRHEDLLRQNIHDQFAAEGQTYLAKGDLVNYQSLLDQRLASKDISLAQYEALGKSALGDSLLQQSRDLLSSDRGIDNQRALGILENLPDAVELTTEQKEYRNRMLKLASVTSKEKADETITSIVIQKDNLKDAPVLEKHQAAQQMKQSLVDGGVTGDKLNQWFGILDEWAGGDTDPTEQYDPQIYSGLQATVDLNPESITNAQIYSFVGQGTDGGVSIQQARSLVDRRKSNLDDTGKPQNEYAKRYQTILKGMYDGGSYGEGLEGARQYAETANRLTIFANTNKDATAQEFEQFFDNLTADTEKASWIKIGLSWLPPFSYFKALRVAGTGREVMSNVDADIERITQVRERIQTEAWERRRQRQVGREIVHQGQRWRLVRKGDTVDEDVYERVE
jgi:hypothetical protein